MKHFLLFISLLALFFMNSLQAQVATIGVQTSTHADIDFNNTGPALTLCPVYGAYYTSSRMQYIILASELNAAGITGKSNLSSIAFNVISLSASTGNTTACGTTPATPGTHANFNIKLKNTTATSLASPFDNLNLTTVLNPITYNPVTGWNTHTFNIPFEWDGVSNLLVDICHDNGNGSTVTCYTGSPQMALSSTSFNSTLHSWADSQNSLCGVTTGPNGMNNSPDRAHMQIGYTSLNNPQFNVIPVPNFAYDKGIDTVWVNSPHVFVNTSSSDSVHYWDVTSVTGASAAGEPRSCFPGFSCYLSTERNYNRTFTQIGLYNVKLVVGNKVGKDSITKQVYVGNPSRKPRAEFYFDRQTMGISQQVQGYDYSLYGPTSWQWSFNPPNDSNKFLPSANVPNPLFAGRQIGTYDICLKVTNPVGSDSVCKPAHLAVSSGNRMCDGSSGSSDLNGYLYSNKGATDSYDPTTMATNCSYFINPCATGLTAYIEKFNLRKSDTIIFRNSGPTGTIIAKIGANNKNNILTIPASSGRLYVQWQLANNNPINGGDSGFVMRWSSVAATYTIPSVQFKSLDTIYSGQNMVFTNQSAGQGLLEYSWDVNGDSIFGDFTTATGANYTFTTEERVVKYVCLKVSNCRGEGKYCRQLTILPIVQKPEVRFIASMTAAFTTDEIRLTDQSKYGVQSWSWSVSPNNVVYTQGTNAFSQNPVIKLTIPGTYSITLTALNPQGIESFTRTQYITVLAYLAAGTENPIATSSDVGISRVQIGSVSNDNTGTFTPITDVSSALKTPVYDTAFKTITTTVYRGVKYRVLADRLTSIEPMDRKIWLDKNLDVDFVDAGEELYAESNATNLRASADFMIPETLDAGRYMRLRVGISQGNTTLTPNKAGAGCFEDYGLLIGVDATPPQISLKGSSLYQVEVNKTFTDPGVLATDNLEGDISIRAQSVSNLDITRTGIYTIRYYVTDLYGNVSDTISRTVQVEINRTGPVITLNGSDTQYVEVKSVYTDPGATAVDNNGGSLNGKLAVSGSIDPDQVGTYYISYTVTDQFNFKATKTRVVYIRDTQAPVMGTRYGSTTIRHQIGTPYTDYNIVVTDNYYTRQQITLTRSGTINSNKEDSYFLRYTACDGSNNCTADYFVQVEVEDTIAPEAKLLGANPLIADVYEAYTDPGVEATDNYYANSSLVILKNSTVNINKLDTYDIVYTVKDGGGNRTQLSRRVIVADRKAPVIELFGSSPFELQRFKDFEDPGYKVSDNYNSDQELHDLVTTTSNMSVRSVNGNNKYWGEHPGWKYVRYQVRDLSGNTSEITEREIRVTELTGVEETALSNGSLSVYPNPNNGTFSFSTTTQGKGTLTVYNALGAKVHSQDIDADQKGTGISVRNLAAGVYLVRLSINNTEHTLKMVVRE